MRHLWTSMSRVVCAVIVPSNHGYPQVNWLVLRCLMKVTVADAVATDLRWIGELFEIVSEAKRTKRSIMCVWHKLLFAVYSKSSPLNWDCPSVPERFNFFWHILRLSRQFNFVRKNVDLIAFLTRITSGPNKESSKYIYTFDFCLYHWWTT